MAATHPDPETALDTLIAAGAVDESADGTLTTTEPFEKVLSLYHDVYGSVSTEEFHTTVTDLFGIDPAVVETRIDELEIDRTDVVAYLALKSFFERPVDQELLAVMAEVVVEITPSSCVPDVITELDDDSYASFLDANPDAVLTVWRRFCDPCEAMKEDLEDVLDRLPAGVTIAGVDGEATDNFCRTFDVGSAPTLLCFADGELVEIESGRQSVAEVQQLLDRVY